MYIIKQPLGYYNFLMEIRLSHRSTLCLWAKWIFGMNIGQATFPVNGGNIWRSANFGMDLWRKIGLALVFTICLRVFCFTQFLSGIFPFARNFGLFMATLANSIYHQNNLSWYGASISSGFKSQSTWTISPFDITSKSPMQTKEMLITAFKP